MLRPRAKDDHGLAGFHDRKTFPDSSYDRPFSNRPSRGGVVREMGRRPRPQLMIVGQCRQGLERQLLRIDQASTHQPVSGRHDQLPLILEQDRALHQAVMGKWKSAKRCVDLAHGNRRKLVQHRKFHPFDIDLELALQMPDRGQGQLVKATTEETDFQSICLTKRGLPAILQSSAEHQRRGLDAEAQLLTKRRQLNPPARSYEQLPPNLTLQGTYRFGDGGLGERKSLRRPCVGSNPSMRKAATAAPGTSCHT